VALVRTEASGAWQFPSALPPQETDVLQDQLETVLDVAAKQLGIDVSDSLCSQPVIQVRCATLCRTCVLASLCVGVGQRQSTPKRFACCAPAGQSLPRLHAVRVAAASNSQWSQMFNVCCSTWAAVFHLHASNVL
jgi:hypothetical protein